MTGKWLYGVMRCQHIIFPLNQDPLMSIFADTEPDLRQHDMYNHITTIKSEHK